MLVAEKFIRSLVEKYGTGYKEHTPVCARKPREDGRTGLLLTIVIFIPG